jgi:hypothetical protein
LTVNHSPAVETLEHLVHELEPLGVLLVDRQRARMFVYQFGRRHPPYKFSIRKGRLMIAGCWTRFPQVEGDPGFADLASMLNLDEKSSAKAVPVSGLDPDEVWKIGETVSRAINE